MVKVNNEGQGDQELMYRGGNYIPTFYHNYDAR